MKTETKETKKVLKKVFMVGHSDCSFGEKIIQDLQPSGGAQNQQQNQDLVNSLTGS